MCCAVLCCTVVRFGLVVGKDITQCIEIRWGRGGSWWFGEGGGGWVGVGPEEEDRLAAAAAAAVFVPAVLKTLVLRLPVDMSHPIPAASHPCRRPEEERFLRLLEVLGEW